MQSLVDTSSSIPEVHHELQTFPDADALAEGAARFIAKRAHELVTAKGSFSVAMSGGKTPWAMLVELSSLDLPWADMVIYQVDERIAPPGDPMRNLTNLERCLATVHPSIVPMAVNDSDLTVASRCYGAALPERIDLIHLGLGADGHTASLIPGDPVLEVTDRLVAVTGEYQNYRRMTITYPALARADEILWLVSGIDKRQALSMLMNGDTSIPAGRVEAAGSLIMTDQIAI